MSNTNQPESLAGVWRRPPALAFIILALVCASSYISPPLALAIGLVFALIVGNPFPKSSQKAAKFLLQASVVGLGFGMNLAAVLAAGKMGFWFTVGTIGGTLLLGWLLGRLLHTGSQVSTLISSGTAICGGSAIAAVGAAIRADSRAMSVALGTVFVLNSVALFLFPPMGHWLHLSQQQFGIWAAIAIHDTSSVVGAAAKYGDQALAIATTVKLARALWIVPVALACAWTHRCKGARMAWPWFILFFILAAGVRTLFPQGAEIYNAIRGVAKIGLTLTLFLIGSQLSREALRSVGVKALLQGVILWLVVSLAGLAAVWRLVAA